MTTTIPTGSRISKNSTLTWEAPLKNGKPMTTPFSQALSTSSFYSNSKINTIFQKNSSTSPVLSKSTTTKTPQTKKTPKNSTKKSSIVSWSQTNFSLLSPSLPINSISSSTNIMKPLLCFSLLVISTNTLFCINKKMNNSKFAIIKEFFYGVWILKI